MDENAAPQNEDKPESDSAPESGTSADTSFAEVTIPDDAGREWFEKQYGELRSDYTRKTQALAEERKQIEQYRQEAELMARLRSDETTQAQVFRELAERLGYDLDDDEDDEYEDSFRDPRVDQLLAEREEQQKAQELASLESHIDHQIDEIAKRENLQVSDKTRDWLFAKVLSLPPRADGNPDVESAVADFRVIQDEWQKSYVESKRTPVAPGVGQAGVPKFDPTDEKQRRQAMAAIIEARQNAG